MTKIPKELYYLDQRFSVKSLCKYQLKSILNTHKIVFCSKNTRINLIDLFKTHIEPHREEILHDYEKKQAEGCKKEYIRGRRSNRKYTYSCTKKTKAVVERTCLVIKRDLDADGFKIPAAKTPRSKIGLFSSIKADDFFDDDCALNTLSIQRLSCLDSGFSVEEFSS
ncbi:hypothetical protein BDF21DRAFT_399633 [Thamnidium elegans]|uniref:Uncharacterized protein n=1 Tax=Thamnidium elegans TaxID=101142 RepID=A0A8H7SKW4_9FUNG|nr:hypothetical protein INT48_007394 [Thamnidium elegans]KAI8078382.1 hypothetical protein BDF21DRAFT_399633 [Thamnidium elegans]